MKKDTPPTEYEKDTPPTEYEYRIARMFYTTIVLLAGITAIGVIVEHLTK